MKKLFGLVLCSVLVLGITGCGNKKTEKVVSYLENKEFTCEGKGNNYSCSLVKGVKKHKFDIMDIGSGEHRELVYIYDDDTNTYEIRTGTFKYGDWIILKDDIDDEKCLYYVENRIETVKYDEKSCFSNDIDCMNKNSYCRDYLPQVRESVSMFLNIYEENDIELKLIYSK